MGNRRRPQTQSAVLNYDPSDSDVASDTLQQYLPRTTTENPATKPKSQTVSEKFQRRKKAWKRRYKASNTHSAEHPFSTDEESANPTNRVAIPDEDGIRCMNALPRPSTIVPDVSEGATMDAGLTESERATYQRLVKATELRVQSYDRDGRLLPISEVTRAGFGLQDYSTFLNPPAEDRAFCLKRVPGELLSHHYRGAGLIRRLFRRKPKLHRETYTHVRSASSSSESESKDNGERSKAGVGAPRMAHAKDDDSDVASAPSDRMADFDYWCPSDTYEAAERRRVLQREKRARKEARKEQKAAERQKKKDRRAISAKNAKSTTWHIAADVQKMINEGSSDEDDTGKQGSPSDHLEKCASGPGQEKTVAIHAVDNSESSHSSDQESDSESESESSSDSAKGKSLAVRLEEPPPPPPPEKPLFDDLMMTLSVNPESIIDIPRPGGKPEQSAKKEEDWKIEFKNEEMFDVKDEPVIIDPKEQTEENGGDILPDDPTEGPDDKLLMLDNIYTGFEAEKYLGLMYCQASEMVEVRSFVVPTRQIGNGGVRRRPRRRREVLPCPPAKRPRGGFTFVGTDSP